MKSKIELMTYEMKPAGHDKPEDKRKYEKPANDVSKAFEQWLVGLPGMATLDDYKGRFYSKAADLIHNIEIDLGSAHALLLYYQDHPKIQSAGLFISAVYNKVPDKEIVYDLEIDKEIDYLAANLKKDKTFVSRIPAGYNMGDSATGTIVNYSEAAHWFGAEAKGLVLNYGSAGETAGHHCNAIINYGSTEDQLGQYADTAINLGKTKDRFGGVEKLAINYGTTAWGMGHESKNDSTVINYGKAGEGLGANAEGRIISLKKPKSYGDTSLCKLILQENECRQMPRLSKLLNSLKTKLEQGRHDHKKAIKAWKSVNMFIFEKQLEQIVGSKYEWF